MHQAKLWDYLFQGTAAPEVSRRAPKPHDHTQLQGARTPSTAAWVRKAKAQVSRFIQNLEERQQQDLSNPLQGSNQDWVRSWYIIHEKRTKSLERTEQWTQHRKTLLSMENPVAEHPDSTGEERTWSWWLCCLHLTQWTRAAMNFVIQSTNSISTFMLFSMAFIV